MMVYEKLLITAIQKQEGVITDAKELRDRTENDSYKRYLSIVITDAENALFRLYAIRKGEVLNAG